MTAPPVPAVQIFGLTDSRPTRAALRFFKERRVAVQYVDAVSSAQPRMTSMAWPFGRL